MHCVSHVGKWIASSIQNTRGQNKGGTVVRALAFHQCGPGLIPRPIVPRMWVEFVVGSLLAPRGFSLAMGTPVFPSPQKPTFF